MAAGIGALALDRGRDAARERDLAEQASEAAAHEALVGRSLTLRSTNRSVAALLAVQAFRSRPDHLSQSALLASFIASPGFLGYRYLEGDDRLNAAGIPDTRAPSWPGPPVTSVSSTSPPGPSPTPSALRCLEPWTTPSCGSARTGAGWPSCVSTPRDPDRCGSLESLERRDGRGCSSLVVHDIATGERLLGPVEVPFSGEDVAISDYGDLVAVTGGYDGDLATYDVDDRSPAGATRRAAAPGRGRAVGGTPPPWPSTPPGTSTWGRWPGRSARSTRAPSRSSGPSRRRGCPPTWARGHGHGCSGDLNNLLVAAGNEALVAIDLTSGRRRWVADLRGELFPEPCPFFAVADGVSRVYCGNHFGQVEERDLATGQRTGLRLDPQLGSVGDLVGASAGVSGARGVRRR